jgi:hypothetical protein
MSKDGGPAFPHVWVDNGQRAEISIGMTLRDYFAAKAMQATIIAAGSWGPMEFLTDFHSEKASEFAYKQADAMLAEREKA